MSRPRHQRQRHRVHDVGADDLHHWQARVEQQQRGHADGAGADRGDRNQHAKHGARQHGRDRGGLFADPLQPEAIALHHRLAENQRGGGEHQREAKHCIDEASLRGRIEIEFPHHEHGRDARRNAAAGKPDHGRPVNAAPEAVNQPAAGLGGRGVKQVGADSGRGMNAEQQDQQRRHQRAAAHACHSDQQADGKSRCNIERVDHIPAVCDGVGGYVAARRCRSQWQPAK